MPTHFFDTSALAKRYYLEVGSDAVQQIIELPQSRTLISSLTVVELESVSAIRTRVGGLDDGSSAAVRSRFNADLALKRIIVYPPIESSHFDSAARLLMEYGATRGLRTLDALHLAVALDLRQRGVMEVFVTSDRRLFDVAGATGLTVFNPEQPGRLLI